MSYRKVDAGRGVEWLKDGIGLVLKNPAVFLVMALIMAIIAVIPLLGQLAMIILGPALWGGMVYAFREQDHGRNAEIGQLFRAFQEQGKIGPMIALCLPGIAAGVVLAILAFVLIGGALLGAGVSAGANSGAGMAASLGMGFLLFFLIMLVVVLAAYALLIFAIPRVMFDGVEPFAAMKESVTASLANFAPLLVFSLIFFVVFVVAGIVLALIPILGQILLMLAAYAISGAVIYVAYKDVYDVGTPAAVMPEPNTPPPPPG